MSIRYYKIQDEDNYEIILNDVTKVKLNEKKNAEFKYKTIFLSKVAHEFKNPLICIIELIDQLFDLNRNVDGRDFKAFRELASQIKGISNYLLILVKDLDYFSISQTKLSFNLEYEKCNLEEITQFVTDMGIILLKKAHKQDKIKFIIEKDPNLNVFVTTDEIKLKQILVNLLSNSVKFTHKGEIRLQIANNPDNESDVDFTLTDTGIGIKKEKQNYSLFKKNLDKANNMGAGLGLYIIAELTGQLGTPIQISSELGQGSEFKFTLKNNDEMLRRVIEAKDKHPLDKNKEAFNNNNILNNNLINFPNQNKNVLNINHSKRSSKNSPLKFKGSLTYNNFRPIAEENSSFLETNRPSLLKGKVMKKKVKSHKPNKRNKGSEAYILDNTRSSNTRIISETNYYINHNNVYIFNNNNRNELNGLNEFANCNNNNAANHKGNFFGTKSRNSSSLSFGPSNPSLNSQYEIINKINKNLLAKENKDNEENTNLNANRNNNNFNLNNFKTVNNNTIGRIYTKINDPNTQKIVNYNKRNSRTSLKQMDITSEKESETKINLKEINIIVSDDEDLTRQSTIRMIRRNFEVNNLRMKFELVIYEAKDGLDCLTKFYNLIMDGNEIYCIISDESMYFMNGSECSVVVKKVIEKRELNKIPFFLVTAYPRENFGAFLKRSVDDLYNKPINFEDVNEIFKTLIHSLKESNHNNSSLNKDAISIN